MLCVVPVAEPVGAVGQREVVAPASTGKRQLRNLAAIRRAGRRRGWFGQLAFGDRLQERQGQVWAVKSRAAGLGSATVSATAGTGG